MEWLDKILNSTAFTWIVSVIFVCIFALVIFGKTSLGKKALNTLKSKISGLEGSVKAKHEQVDKILIETKNALCEYEKQIDEKIALFDEREETLRNLVILIGENIHNEKVKTLIETYKENYDIDLASVKEDYKTAFDSKLKELDELIKTYKEKIEDRVEEIKEEVVEDGKEE